MFDNEQFFATPSELAIELVSKLHNHKSDMILEPSAGTGSLLEFFSKENIHCIEINEQRAAFLEGNGYKVVWDDFLTFTPLMPYDTIIMNPPFCDGAKHLLKALDVCAAGGEIVCILNAETIKNPFSNERKRLIKTLDEQEHWDYEIVENAFASADRKSNVTVALVYVKIKAANNESIILNHFKKFVVNERQTSNNDNALIRSGEVEQLIDRHHAEVLAALALFDEINNYNSVALADPAVTDVFKIDCTSSKRKIVKKINLKYWKALFRCRDISDLVTSKVATEYQNKLYEMADFDFNERNILQLKEDLIRNLFKNIDDAIEKTFDYMTHEFSCEKTDNIHYYNGWKTNKAFYVNKKVILPMYAFEHYSGWGIKPYYKFKSYKVEGKINDIERVMNHLDGGRTNELNLFKQLRMAQETGNSKNIDTKYFTITFYKKGTAHFTFKDDKLRKKFNIYAGRKKNWLPPSYGVKHYEAMNDEEKAVIDSFEGKDSYEQTVNNPDFFLANTTATLLLHAAN